MRPPITAAMSSTLLSRRNRFFWRPLQHGKLPSRKGRRRDTFPASQGHDRSLGPNAEQPGAPPLVGPPARQSVPRTAGRLAPPHARTSIQPCRAAFLHIIFVSRAAVLLPRPCRRPRAAALRSTSVCFLGRLVRSRPPASVKMSGSPGIAARECTHARYRG